MSDVPERKDDRVYGEDRAREKRREDRKGGADVEDSGEGPHTDDGIL